MMRVVLATDHGAFHLAFERLSACALSTIVSAALAIDRISSRCQSELRPFGLVPELELELFEPLVEEVDANPVIKRFHVGHEVQPDLLPKLLLQPHLGSGDVGSGMCCLYCNTDLARRLHTQARPHRFGVRVSDRQTGRRGQTSGGWS
jgi:hypothetical protein